MLEDVIKIVTQSMQISENITEEVKSELVGEVLVICVREIMKNHVYIFNGQAYLQNEGGAIGLRLKGLVAKVVMDGWKNENANDNQCQQQL